MAAHHTVAWFDRWMKTPGEPGYDTADARLLDDDTYCERFSFYFRSARNFPLRDGTPAIEDDIRDRCLSGDAAPTDEPAPAPEPEPEPTPEPAPLPATGGGLALAGAALLLGATLTRGRRLPGRG